MKLRLVIALTAAVALQATAVWAQGDLDASQRDVRFLRQAARAGLFEFELGQLAMSRGPTQALRDFGLLEAADHSGINGQLEETAAFHGIEVPTTLTRSQQRALDRLTRLADIDDDRFVRALLNESIRSHRRSIQLYQREIEKGQSANVTGFAERTVGLQEHLDQALELRSTLVGTSNRSARAQRLLNRTTASNQSGE